MEKVMEGLGEKRNSTEKARQTIDTVEEYSLESLEKVLDQLSDKVKYLAKKNGFSKKLKKKVELELL